MSDPTAPAWTGTISGYNGSATENVDGSVTITVEIGFPVGSPSFTIPAAEWAAIVAACPPRTVAVT